MKQLGRVTTMFSRHPGRRISANEVAAELGVSQAHGRALLCVLLDMGVLERCVDRRRFVPHGPATSLYQLKSATQRDALVRLVRLVDVKTRKDDEPPKEPQP